MFRTITARYAGTCQRCKLGFEAGTKVRYNGRACWHLKSECPDTQGATAPMTTGPGRDFGDRVEARAEFGYDGPQMGYWPNEDSGDF